MADDLKRVGIKLTAEGAEAFQGSLKSVNAEIKKSVQEFAKARAEYDKNTSSTKKLEDRQTYLTKASDAYTQKIAIMKAELIELENSENADQKAIDKKRNSIAQAEIKLTEYKKSLEDVNTQLKVHAGQLTDWGNKLKDFGDKASANGKALSIGVTAPIAAMAAGAVKGWQEVDDAMDTITQKTGASGKALESFQDSAKRIAETIPVSFDSAANAVGEVATRFSELSNGQVEELSTQFAEFAELNDTDVSSSVDSVQKALAAFGQSSSDAGNLLDALNKVGQDTGISVDKLSSGLVSNASALMDMGFTAEQAAGFMGQVEKSGVDTSVMLAGLKKAQKNAAAEGTTLNASLSSFSDVMSSNASDTDKLQKAYDLFGAKAGASIYEACKTGSIALNDLGGDLGDYAGNVSKTFNETLDPMDRVTTALNTAKDLGAEIVDASAPLITTVLGGLVNGIKALKDWFDKLSPGMQATIPKLAGIAAAVGPVILVVGKLTSGIGGFLTNLAAAATSAGSLGGGLMAMISPVTLVIAAIAAVVAALVVLYNNNETFHNFVTTAWANIKDVIESVITRVQELWTTVLQPAFQAIGDFAKNILLPAIQVAFMTISTVVSTVFNFISGIWNNILQPVFSAIATFVKSTLLPAVSTAFNAIKSAVSSAFNGIKGVWTGVLQPTFNAIKNALSPIQQKVSSVFGGILNKITSVFNSIQSRISPIVEWLKGIFNFHWSLPHIALPHFGISGSFSLAPPSVPSISIDWYAKAMSNATILDAPTIFGMGKDGKALGGGEVGHEVVAGEQKLLSMIRQAVRDAGAGNTFDFSGMTITVTGGTDMTPTEIADYVYEYITQKLRRAKVVFA